MKRGRKSTAELNVIPFNVDRAKVISAPKGLTAIERDIFNRTARLNGHLSDANSELLCAYAQAVAKTMRLAKKDDGASVKSWDQACRAMVLLARSLRLTNQSQVHKETAARGVRGAASPSFYDTMDDSDD